MRFAVIIFEFNQFFLYQRKTVPGLDRFSELSSLVDDFVGLRDCLRVRIGTVCHIAVFKKVFNFVGNFVNYGDRVVVHSAHFLFEIVQLAW